MANAKQLRISNGDVTIYCKNIREAAKAINLSFRDVRAFLATYRPIPKCCINGETVEGCKIKWAIAAKPKNCITQYDINFSKVAEFSSLLEAVNTYDIPKLYDIMKQPNRKYAGFFWSYSNIDVFNEYRPILVVDAAGKVVGKYNSIKEASDDTCVECNMVFRSIMTGSDIYGLFFTMLTHKMLNIVEVDSNNKIIHIYDDPKEVIENVGVTRNQLYYMIDTNKWATKKYLKNGIAYYKYSLRFFKHML